MKFIASFGYTTANSQKIRSETQLIEAKDLAAARLAAQELGSKSYDWFKINSVKPV